LVLRWGLALLMRLLLVLRVWRHSVWGWGCGVYVVSRRLVLVERAKGRIQVQHVPSGVGAGCVPGHRRAALSASKVGGCSLNARSRRPLAASLSLWMAPVYLFITTCA